MLKGPCVAQLWMVQRTEQRLELWVAAQHLEALKVLQRDGNLQRHLVLRDRRSVVDVRVHLVGRIKLAGET